MASRRDFLHLSGLAASGLLLLQRTGCASPGSKEGPAFGLFFDAKDLEGLRAQFAQQPMFGVLRGQLAAIDREAERRFLAEEVRYNDHLFHIKRVSDTARQMAFLYVMTGDEEAAALAIACARTLMRFPKWDYFLEAGTEVFGLQRAPGATLAVALCADWLEDRVSDEERSQWLQTMGERGCEACYRALYGMRHPDRVVGWTMDTTSTYLEHRPGDTLDVSNWPVILDETNLKAVPASALAIGTVAYQQHFGADDASERWMEQALYSLNTFRTRFAEDGSYDEGVSYANYTALHLAQAIAALQRRAETDLSDLINWAGYDRYLYGMTLSTNNDPYAIVNFGDAGLGATSAVSFWRAQGANSAEAQWFGETLARAHDEWSVLWYDPSVQAIPPSERPHLWQSSLDWMVARTGYTPDDLVVAMRSGGPANHEHADRNSLIVKCYGEQLVTDPYRPPYSFTDPAWMMRTTAGHSALLIDGEGHQYHDGSEGTNPSNAVARIVQRGEEEGYCFWTSDATPAYQMVVSDVQSVTRTVIVLYDLPVIIVLDKVIKQAIPSRLQARYFGYNLDGQGHIEADGSQFRTLRPGVVLQGLAYASTGVQVEKKVLPVPEEKASLHPFAEVSMISSSLMPLLITVLLPERSPGGQAQAQVRTESEGLFDIIVQQGDQEARLHIRDSGIMPEFDVVL